MAKKSSINPYDSILINRDLERIKDIVDQNDDYYWSDNPKMKLLKMKAEIENILNEMDKKYLQK